MARWMDIAWKELGEAEIRSISGHNLETIHQVLKHYIALDDRMAVSAIDRLKHWMQEEGIAI
jgi:hypothetical protein